MINWWNRNWMQANRCRCTAWWWARRRRATLEMWHATGWGRGRRRRRRPPTTSTRTRRRRWTSTATPSSLRPLYSPTSCPPSSANWATLTTSSSTPPVHLINISLASHYYLSISLAYPTICLLNCLLIYRVGSLALIAIRIDHHWSLAPPTRLNYVSMHRSIRSDCCLAVVYFSRAPSAWIDWPIRRPESVAANWWAAVNDVTTRATHKDWFQLADLDEMPRCFNPSVAQDDEPVITI